MDLIRYHAPFSKRSLYVMSSLVRGSGASQRWVSSTMPRELVLMYFPARA